MAEAGYRVTGKVQGVGFRWWTHSLATSLGLTGTVRNHADGAVVVHARGTDDQLRAFAERLAQGPRPARVTAVDPLPFSADGMQDGTFSILR